MKILSLCFIFCSLISCTSNQESVFNKDGSIKVAQIKANTPKDIVMLWNDAINERRWDVLNKIYSGKLNYYSKEKSKEDCLQHKIKKIEQNKDFSQSIADINIIQTYYNTYEVYFKKSFSTKKGKDTVIAFLSIIKINDNEWEIVQESDIITRNNNNSKICSCSDFWIALYNEGSPNYYLLSNEGIYYGKDGMYSVVVTYDINKNGGNISFILREMSEYSTSGWIESIEFDIKEEVMSDINGGHAEKYNKRFFKQLSKYCK